MQKYEHTFANSSLKDWNMENSSNNKHLNLCLWLFRLMAQPGKFCRNFQINTLTAWRPVYFASLPWMFSLLLQHTLQSFSSWRLLLFSTDSERTRDQDARTNLFATFTLIRNRFPSSAGSCLPLNFTILMYTMCYWSHSGSDQTIYPPRYIFSLFSFAYDPFA